MRYEVHTFSEKGELLAISGPVEASSAADAEAQVKRESPASYTLCRGVETVEIPVHSHQAREIIQR